MEKLHKHVWPAASALCTALCTLSHVVCDIY